jgi:hypothetical protein
MNAPLSITNTSNSHKAAEPTASANGLIQRMKTSIQRNEYKYFQVDEKTILCGVPASSKPHYDFTQVDYKFRSFDVAGVLYLTIYTIKDN